MENLVSKYRDANKAKRREIQTEIVRTYRPRVEWLVRGLVPERYRDEAEQFGLIGLLVALEKAPPGVEFWSFAREVARDEIRRAEFPDDDGPDGPDGDDGEPIPEDDALFMRRAA